MLVSTKEMLTAAREGHYAVPMFDVCNYEMIRTVVETAEAQRSPVMLGALEVDIKGGGLDYFIAMAKVAAASVSVPVAIHLDHATTFEQCKRVIDAGFNSVMIDASTASFDDNVAKTKAVVAYAHARNVTVEAELGHVPDAVAGTGEAAHQGAKHVEIKDSLTQPGDVVRFVELTGVDALAIAIGTAHGSYISAPELEIGLLKEINEVSPACLVLHGGSGTPEDQVKEAIANGITKINVFTDLLIAYNTKLRDTLAVSDNMGKWPVFVNEEPLKMMKEAIISKMVAFGSAGKA